MNVTLFNICEVIISKLRNVPLIQEVNSFITMLLSLKNILIKNSTDGVNIIVLIMVLS